MRSLPDFHLSGPEPSDFFAVAFIRGRYVSPSGASDEPARLGLYLSRSPGFAPVNAIALPAAETDDRRLWYSRGNDFLTSVEFALLRLWRTEQIDPGAWRLYPRDHIADDAFDSEATRAAYWETRERLCAVLWVMRAEARVRRRGPAVAPLFYVEEEVPILGDGSEDDAELQQTAAALSARIGTTDGAQ